MRPPPLAIRASAHSEQRVQRPLAIRDRRRSERRVAASYRRIAAGFFVLPASVSASAVANGYARTAITVTAAIVRPTITAAITAAIVRPRSVAVAIVRAVVTIAVVAIMMTIAVV